MWQYRKRIILGTIIISTVFLSWCTWNSGTQTTVWQFTFTLPTTYESISASRLDQYQIVNNIIGARKWTDKSSLVLSESSLPSSVTIKQFAQDTQTRLAQNMIGYTNWKLSSKSFTCNGQKIAWYIHTFTQTDIKDKTKVTQYYTQYYYWLQWSVYILSLAHTQENSIVNTIVSSYGCIAKK